MDLLSFIPGWFMVHIENEGVPDIVNLKLFTITQHYLYNNITLKRKLASSHYSNSSLRLATLQNKLRKQPKFIQTFLDSGSHNADSSRTGSSEHCHAPHLPITTGTNS